MLLSLWIHCTSCINPFVILVSPECIILFGFETYSIEEVKKMTNSCPICCECKPRYHRPDKSHLIKATQPFERSQDLSAIGGIQGYPILAPAYISGHTARQLSSHHGHYGLLVSCVCPLFSSFSFLIVIAM